MRDAAKLVASARTVQLSTPWSRLRCVLQESVPSEGMRIRLEWDNSDSSRQRPHVQPGRYCLRGGWQTIRCVALSESSSSSSEGSIEIPTFLESVEANMKQNHWFGTIT